MSDHVKTLERWIANLKAYATVPWAMPEPTSDELEAAGRALLEELEQLRVRKCEHGWRGSRPEEGERIRTPCPSCGLQALFIGTGGHLTCSSVPSEGSRGCPSPIVAKTWEDQKARIEAALALRRPADMVAEGRALHESEQPTDRYWLGWDDAMEVTVKALRGEK